MILLQLKNETGHYQSIVNAVCFLWFSLWQNI